MKGIFDHVRVPDRLTAHVVTAEADPRIHGYAVMADLAANNLGFLDVGWLSLTGELPTAGERAALNRALLLLAPLHVGQGPTHAAVLARVAGAYDQVIPGIAAAALGQHTLGEITTFNRVRGWLDGESEGPGAEALATSPEAIAAWAQLVAESADWFDSPLPAAPALSREAAAYALFYRLGITDTLRLQALSLWARLPVMLAEAACTPPASVTAYPARLPAYTYTEG